MKTFRHSSYSSENLIILVKKFPCIWDNANPNYVNKEMKELAWNQICEGFFTNWDICTDKCDKMSDLKKKWSNIRDYHRKNVMRFRKDKTKKLKHIYSDLLTFLEPVFEKIAAQKKLSNKNIPCTQHSNSESGDEENIDSEDISVNELALPLRRKENYDKIRILVHESKAATTASDSEDINVNESTLPLRKKENNGTLKILANDPEAATSSDSESEDDHDNDDINFLLSFRGYMKEMNTNQKLEFKIGMLQLIKNLKAQTELFES